MIKSLAISVSLALGLLTSYAYSANPFWTTNDAWITLSGTVESVSADSFNLNFGSGTVLVEMDDGDRDADAYKLLKGDKVTVTGKIDRDLFETTKIEAGTVFVENLSTTFYSSSIDEEDIDFYYSQTPAYTVVVGSTNLSGTIAEIEGRHLILNTGSEKVTVDTNEMKFNPLDDKGYLQLKKGDRITVSGVMTQDFFKGREFEATTIVSYVDKSKEKSKKSDQAKDNDSAS